MSAAKSLVLSSLVCALGFAVSACSNDANSGQDGGCAPQLYYVSPQAQAVLPSGTATLAVRLEDCNAVTLANAAVSYRLTGDTKGAKLSSASVNTDAQGDASADVTAGATETTFQVEVSAAHSNSLTFDITVSLNAPGEIMVNMSYNGVHAFNEFLATLHQNETCADLPAFALPTALQSAPSVASILAHPSFSNVTPGSGYAVVVRAKVAGKILGYGCTDTLNVDPGQVTTAAVAIHDVPTLFDGVYSIDSHFDFSDNLPPSINQIVHIFDEMTDDHDPDCVAGPECLDPTNPVPTDCGCDPAAFIVDFLYRPLCAWDCGTDPNVTYADCGPWSPSSHPYGDLRDTYLNSMGSWADARSWKTVSSIGTCSIVDLGKISLGSSNLQSVIQGYIEANAPNLLLAIVQIAGDLSRAIDKMHIKSQLALSQVSADTPGQFHHMLQTMVVTIHDLSGTATDYEFDLAAAGLTNLTTTGTATVVNGKLTIPAHQYTLNFGKLIFYIYESIILPVILPNCGQAGNPTCNTAGLLQTLVDCTAVGDWLSTNISSTLCSSIDCASLCTTALAVGGGYIDSWIQNSITSTSATVTIGGNCDPAQIDDSQLAQALINGIWDPAICTWQEGSNSGSFSGTFNGTRLPNAG